MFGIENPQPGEYYWGGSDARSGGVPYGWSSNMWVPGNVAVGSTLQTNQKARLGIKIPGDINWTGNGDRVAICWSAGFNPGKGSVVDGTMWLSGYLCDNKANGPIWNAKENFTIDATTTLYCGRFESDNNLYDWGACDYVMVTLQTHEQVNHSGYMHVSFNLSTWRQSLSGPL